jgi:predicted alpha/beta-hydrolase family hydrolase
VVTSGGEETTAVFDPAPQSTRHVVFVCAHGAGGSYADRGVVHVCEAVRSQGLSTVRFNFLYRERKASRPDPMPRLTACFEAVVEHVRRELQPDRLIIGGRSMGGRAASMMAAAAFPCDGLLLLAYPLHPPGQPDKLRDAHLPAVHVPTLCINGTRDDFCSRPLMEQVLTRVAPTFRMHWVDGADHSFHVLKSSGRTDQDVMREIAGEVSRWIRD